jgi:hypothetical protein
MSKGKDLKEEKNDLGIIFIHGIGEQKKGEMLVSYGDPLNSFLENWLVGSSHFLNISTSQKQIFQIRTLRNYRLLSSR